MPQKIRCKVCRKETVHRHLHDSLADFPGETHMAGSERYECSACGHAIYRKEGDKKGLKFFLDR